MGSVASVFGNVLLAALQNANGQCGIKGSGPLRGDEVIAHVPLPLPSRSSTFHQLRMQCLVPLQDTFLT